MNKELEAELAHSKELIESLVAKNPPFKIMLRWSWLIGFYFFLWEQPWARYVFWAGLVIETIATSAFLYSYFRLKTRIQVLEAELEAG